MIKSSNKHDLSRVEELQPTGRLANSALYDTEEFIELKGEITEVLWRNPHARAHLSVVDDNGEETVWEIETQPGPVEFGRMGISAEDVLGHVRVAGYRSKRNPDSLGVLHLLLPSGQEYIPNNREPLWSDTGVRLVLQEPDPARADQAPALPSHLAGSRRSVGP